MMILEYQVETIPIKVLWSFVWTSNGQAFAMMDGIQMKLLLCVQKLDFPLLVTGFLQLKDNLINGFYQ